MTWYFGDKPFLEPQPEQVGYVYEIRDLANDRLYIGKKLFWTVTKLKPLKGRKNRRHRTNQSDWQDYYGSNEELRAQVLIHGPEKFTRHILVLCYTKTMMSYWETKIQFDRDVLRDPKYYNQFISCKIHQKGLI
jgi:hypothetical protein